MTVKNKGDSKSAFKITVFLFASVLLALSGCGLDDYYYLPQIPDGNIDVEMNTSATIQLPVISGTAYPYFTSFVLFYRIYISGQNSIERIDSAELRRSLSSTMDSDYSYFVTDIDSTNTTVNTTIGTKFTSRKFYELELEDINIKSLLSSSGRLFLDFPNFTIPYMEFGASRYNLWRSNGESVFTPEPDRYFRNTEDLYDSDKAKNPIINADVADISSTTPADIRYTYIMLYIIVAGFHQSNLNTIYSKPTFVGIFKLPDVNL